MLFKIYLIFKKIIILTSYKKNIFYIFSLIWGLGIGDWGLGIGDWAQSPIPNPQKFKIYGN